MHGRTRQHSKLSMRSVNGSSTGGTGRSASTAPARQVAASGRAVAPHQILPPSQSTCAERQDRGQGSAVLGDGGGGVSGSVARYHKPVEAYWQRSRPSRAEVVCGNAAGMAGRAQQGVRPHLYIVVQRDKCCRWPYVGDPRLCRRGARARKGGKTHGGQETPSGPDGQERGQTGWAAWLAASHNSKLLA